MEQFVPKRVYLSCVIVDIIFGVVHNVPERNVDGFFFWKFFFCLNEVGGGEYGIHYLG